MHEVGQMIYHMKNFMGLKVEIQYFIFFLDRTLFQFLKHEFSSVLNIGA